MEYEVGMIHGRFQPFHNGHMDYLKAALKIVKRLYIGITNPYPDVIVKDDTDSHRHNPNSNPYTYFQRLMMIRNSILLDDKICDRYKDIVIIPFPISNPKLYKDYVPDNAVQIMRLFGQWDYKKERMFKDNGYSTKILNGRRITSGEEIRGMNDKSIDELKIKVPEGTAVVLSDIMNEKIMKDNYYEYGMIHGRYQPFNTEHKNIAKKALLSEKVKYLVIGITNPDPQLTTKVEEDNDRDSEEFNRFTYWERMEMINKGILQDKDMNGKYNNIIITPFPISIPKYWKYFIPQYSCLQFATILKSWDEKKIEMLKNAGYEVELLLGKKIENENVYKCQIDENSYDKDKEWIPEGSKDVLKNIVIGTKKKENKAFRQNCLKKLNLYGRSNNVEEIKELILKGKKSIVIRGVGGVGKSALASVIGRELYYGKKEYDLYVWINLKEYYGGCKITFDNILNEILLTIAAAVGNESLEIKKDNIKTALNEYRRVLIILDNYETINKSEEEKDINEYIMEVLGDELLSEIVTVIITTREYSPFWKNSSIDACLKDYNLLKLNEGDAVKMIIENVRRRDVMSIKQCQKVAELVDYLPKILKIAIDQLSSPINVEEWIESIQKASSETKVMFDDFFGRTWNGLDINGKKMMMALTYFSDGATANQIGKVLGLEKSDVFSLITSMSDAYLDNQFGFYKLHPITYKYCLFMLQSQENMDIKKEIDFGYVRLYLEYLKNYYDDNCEDMEAQLNNIKTAVDICIKSKDWDAVIKFWEKSMMPMRFIRWAEREKIVDCAIEALEKKRDKEMLIKCLVEDKIWIGLRLEKEDDVEKYLEQAFSLLGEQKIKSLLPLAYRHRGKLNLIKGLDKYYIPKRNCFEKYFKKAEEDYKESLRLCEEKDIDKGNLYLDFGRLYWLWGLGYDDIEVYDRAIELYQKSNQYTEYAQLIFDKNTEQIQKKLGLAKAYGNKGNVYKSMAKMGKKCNVKSAEEEVKRNINLAVENYEKSLNLSEETKREDEIAHALWGLADIIYFNVKYNN
ncbi:MAG: adenylyltransferase/cytidyltransferase family protein [Chlorobaculum sp.]|nr:adenylyltransferase/cytidyltransferase family protein [Chlorobaculum sp.]